MHSDLEGSSIVIVKNPVEDAVIPPGTLNQAGVMAIATSRAWDAKQGVSEEFISDDSHFRMVGTVFASSKTRRRVGGKGEEEFLAAGHVGSRIRDFMDH